MYPNGIRFKDPESHRFVPRVTVSIEMRSTNEVRQVQSISPKLQSLLSTIQLEIFYLEAIDDSERDKILCNQWHQQV